MNLARVRAMSLRLTNDILERVNDVDRETHTASPRHALPADRHADRPGRAEERGGDDGGHGECVVQDVREAERQVQGGGRPVQLVEGRGGGLGAGAGEAETEECRCEDWRSIRSGSGGG
jgi:hypothetical protein